MKEPIYIEGTCVQYTPEDYVEFYNDRIRAANKRHGWAFVAVLVVIVCAAILLNGCTDYADAANTAKAEQDAYERYMNVQAIARYRLTDQPIKASTLEVSFTICQQYTDINRQWQCWSVK